MPDEIDGDDRLGVSRKFTQKLVSTVEEPAYSVDASMFIVDGADGDEEDYRSERIKRYSVIGNDPSFKQYTKNHDYATIKYSQQR